MVWSHKSTTVGLLILLAALLVGWTPAHAFPQQQAASPAQATAAAKANLRAGPGVTYTRVGGVEAGDVLNLVGCNLDCTWYKTAAGSWILGELLVSPPKDLPKLADAPAAAKTPGAAGLKFPTATPSAPSAATPFATPAATSTANAAAAPSTAGPRAAAAGNLRAGPGTSFERVGQVAAGDPLKVVAQTEAGDWYQLEDGKWIAAFLVEGLGAAPPVAAEVPAPPAATPEPASAAAPSAATPAAQGSSLKVEFINPHYNCEQGESVDNSGERYWAYRSFQADMFITNNGTEPFNPPWEPTRWILTDGTNETVSDMSWQWVLRNMKGLYPQPVIQPGQSVGWTFIVLIPERSQWAKAVEFEDQGTVFRQEFDLGPYGNAYNFQDCGQPRPH